MLKRLAVYLNEMFPPVAAIATIMSAVSVELVYLRLHGIKAAWGLPLLLPGVVLTAISLLIRVMDEFKDYQDDLVNFPARPLPSGRVKKGDLMALGICCALAVVFLSSTSTPLLIWGLVSLVYTGLMLKWFFIEDVMRKSLPLAFATHHPIVIFNFVYLIIACTQFDVRVGWEKWSYVMPIALIYTNWELMRKIRAPEQETMYTTYSKILGPRTAMGIALGIQVFFNLSVMLIFSQLETPFTVRAAYLAVQAILVFPLMKFLFTLKLKGTLRPLAEGQALVVLGFLLTAALL